MKSNVKTKNAKWLLPLGKIEREKFRKKSGLKCQKAKCRKFLKIVMSKFQNVKIA